VVNKHAFEIVRRGVSSIAPTMGDLLIEGVHFCDTLELPWLANQVGKSCIPCGRYRIVLSLSTRYRREMPRLIGVPNRTGILIHSGDTYEDTKGCILVGDGTNTKDFADSNSKATFGHFLAWFRSVGSEAWVTIRNAEPTASLVLAIKEPPAPRAVAA